MNNKEKIINQACYDVRFTKLEEDGLTRTLKSYDELLSEGLITKEEYNEIINEERENLYESKTDKQVIELTRTFLNRNINNLTEEEKLLLDEINRAVSNIEQEYPKQN